MWLDDRDPGLGETMAALDRELERGGTMVSRVEDLNRIVSPLHALGRAILTAGARGFRRPARHRRDRDRDRDRGRDDNVAADPSI